MVPSKEVHVSGTCTRRLTPKGDLLGVTTKSSNVLMHPFDCLPLVLKREVRVSAQASSIGITEDVDAVVCCNDDMTLRTMNPVRWKLSGNINSTSDIAATCKVVDDWELGVRGYVCRCPDCHRQAILSGVDSCLTIKQTLAVVDDQVASDVQCPDRWNG